MSAIGAVSLLVPGQNDMALGELGMQQSLDTCTDGTVDGCRLDTKPQLRDENCSTSLNENKFMMTGQY